MIKSFIILILILNICLNSNGKLVNVKIKEDCEEKREFIYLKNVKEKERFALIINANPENTIKNYPYDKTGSNRKLEVNPENVFNAKINKNYNYIIQLKKKIVIEIANNEIVKEILPKLEKQVFYILII